MEYLISLLCLCTIFAPVLLGVGLTLLAERQIGRWAYLLGWLLPVIIVVILYLAYDVALRVTGCEPSDSLACGQPLAAAFLFSVGFLCVTVIASALAQAAVFLFLNGRRQAQLQGEMGMQPGYEGEYQEYTQGYAQQDMQPYAQPDAQADVQQEEMPQGNRQLYVAPESYTPQNVTQSDVMPDTGDAPQDDLHPYMPPERRGYTQGDDEPQGPPPIIQ